MTHILSLNGIMKRRFIPAFAASMILCASLSPAFAPHAFAQSDRGFGDPNRAVSGAGGGGDLVAQSATVDGGTITTGATAQVVVLFRNDSGSPITTGAIQLYPSSTVGASVALNQCVTEPLAPGAVCAIAVAVKGLQAGPYRVEMLMRHSGRARLVTSALTGTVSAGDSGTNTFKSDIEAIPNELDFGTLTASQPLIRAIVLRNVVSTAIDISSVYVEAAQQSGYSLRTDCAHLEPGGACVVTVTWSPVLEGQATGVLLVEHSGASGVTSVDLNGNYTPKVTSAAEAFPEAVPGKGLLVSSQKDVDFGAGVATTSAITVSLVNVGDAPLTINDIRLGGGDSAGLTVNGGGCAPKMVLEPVQACPLTLTWAPTREGTILDDVQITHDGARGVLVLPIKGTSTVVLSQDSKAIRLVTAEGNTISTTETSGGGKATSSTTSLSIAQSSSMDPASVLDGYQITSHSPTRAIISGSGGSRIVFNKQKVVIGGFLWDVIIRNTGVEFASGDQRVLLLFDKSLASINRSSGQSSGGSSGSSSSSSSSSTPAASAASGGSGSTGSSSSSSSAPVASSSAASAPAATKK